jgi:hypothetical protein
MAQAFRLIGLTNPPKSSAEQMVDHEYFEDDAERQLIKKYLDLGDPKGPKMRPQSRSIPFLLRRK